MVKINLLDSPQDKARAFVKLGRQYNPFSVQYGVVEKVFNRGRGSLSLYRFGKGVRVTVNMGLERESDRKRLMQAMPRCRIIESTLGYPDWYFRGLSDPDKRVRKQHV
jgi:hypothetical protein